jgi:hypothetical protein
MWSLTKKILEIGVAQARFEIPCRRLQTFPGLPIGLVVSSDPEAQCICTISEKRYKVEDDYKITLVPQNPQFASHDFYISDLESLMHMRGPKQEEPSNFKLLEGFEDKVIEVKRDGNTLYFLNNENGPLHREGDEPAVIMADGATFWAKWGRAHRDDGPAYIGPEGQVWFNNGVIHRDNGPAITLPDGNTEFYKYGNKVEH